MNLIDWRPAEMKFEPYFSRLDDYHIEFLHGICFKHQLKYWTLSKIDKTELFSSRPNTFGENHAIISSVVRTWSDFLFWIYLYSKQNVTCFTSTHKIEIVCDLDIVSSCIITWCNKVIVYMVCWSEHWFFFFLLFLKWKILNIVHAVCLFIGGFSQIET